MRRAVLLLGMLVLVAAGGAAARPQASLPFPSFSRAVPVLLYHGIVAGNGYGVPPAVFDAEMQRLHDLGFTAIPLSTYVRFMQGAHVVLPPRPILLTFDDGFVSSWQNADPVLARYGWSAALYLPTGFVGLPGRLTWDQLRQMQASGHWAIDEHAGHGHVTAPIDAAGHRRPVYGAELWLDGKQETFAQYARRVSDDIALAARAIASQLGPGEHETFAVPFGDYGQRGANDPRIEPWFTSLLASRFLVAFVQHDDSYTTPGERLANRITMGPDSSPDVLEARLRSGLDQ